MEPVHVLDALAAAVAAAAIVAFVFGLRDALVAVRVNAFASLSRYFWVYVATPIVALTLIAIVPSIGAAIAAFALGLGSDATAALSGGTVAACLAAVHALAFHRGVTHATTRAQVERPMRTRAATLSAVVLGVAVAATAVLAALVIHHAPSVLVLGAIVGVVDVLLVVALVAASRNEIRHMLAARIAARRAGASEETASDDRPSFVLISIDTLRADRLRAYGGPAGLMPNVDGLGDAGVVCETAIAQSSWTLPSVASMLTGLNPSRHGAGRSLRGHDLLARAPLSPRTWTMPQALRAAGYETHAVVANPYLGIQYGFSAGFDSYENVSIESELLACLRSTLAGRLLEPVLRARVGGNGAVVTERALALLDRLRHQGQARRPFFLWLHYIDPHAPYGCGGDKCFRGDTMLADGGKDDDVTQTHFDAIARLRAGEIRLSRFEKDQLVALYDAGVADVDRQIGAVLERVPPGPKTLIAVASDHGEEFWEHGGVEHGHTYYEELVRVPLVLAGGGLPRRRRIRELVRVIDLPPTVLSLLGVGVPDHLDGESFADAAVGVSTRGPDDRVARCEGQLLFAEDKIGLRTARHKYVRWENGKEELYDLEADPAELRDIAATADLTTFRELTREDDAAPPLDDLPDDVEEHGAVRAALHGLGYV